MSINSMSAALSVIRDNFKLYDRADTNYDPKNPQGNLDGQTSLINIGILAGGKKGNTEFGKFYANDPKRGEMVIAASRYIMAHEGTFLSYFKPNDRLFDTNDINNAITEASKDPKLTDAPGNPKPPKGTPKDTPAGDGKPVDDDVQYGFSRDQARRVLNVFGDITKDNGNLTYGEINTYLKNNPKLATTNKPTYDAVVYLRDNKALFNKLDSLDGNTDGKIVSGSLAKFAAVMA